MAHPVQGIERLLVGEPGPGDVRDAGDRGPVRGDAARRLGELVGDRLDERRVPGRRQPEPPDAEAALGEEPVQAATSASASSSVSTPATAAAVYSPRLCPMSASGRTPNESQSCASAYSLTKSAQRPSTGSSSSLGLVVGSSARRTSNPASESRSSANRSTSERRR